MDFVNCKGTVTKTKDILTISKYFLIKIEEDKRTDRIRHTKQRKFSSVLLLMMIHSYHDSLCSVLVLQGPQLRMSCYVPCPCAKPMHSKART